jgi:hypothetical protein
MEVSERIRERRHRELGVSEAEGNEEGSRNEEERMWMRGEQDGE